MKILVTGRSGQLAQALRAAGIDRDPFEVTSLGRPVLDITNAETIFEALAQTTPDIVVNTAAYTAVEAAERESERAHALNAVGAGRVAECAGELGIPVIHISTDYIFDGSKGTPYSENDLPNPSNAYGRSKLAGEDAVRTANPQHIILRTGWLYSPYGTNFLSTMLRLARERDVIAVVDDQRGNPTQAGDLAQAILTVAAQAAADGGGMPWGTYHAVGADDATWCELARNILRHSARLGGPTAQVVATDCSAFPGVIRPADSRLDCSRLDRAFGITLTGWRRALRHCVALAVASADQ